MLDRHLGPKALLVVVVLAVAFAWGASKLISNGKDDPPAGTASVTATATPCKDTADAFGPPPDTFAYEKVSEKTRASTVKALNLDEAEGKVEMRAVRRTGLTLGTLVRVPAKDPTIYSSGLVQTAQSGGAPVTKAKGYSVLPLQNGTVVAVGVRGCSTILISAQDPKAVPFIAASVFASPAAG